MRDPLDFFHVSGLESRQQRLSVLRLEKELLAGQRLTGRPVNGSLAGEGHHQPDQSEQRHDAAHQHQRCGKVLAVFQCRSVQAPNRQADTGCDYNEGENGVFLAGYDTVLVIKDICQQMVITHNLKSSLNST